MSKAGTSSNTQKGKNVASYICERCGQIFNVKKSLSSHISSKHRSTNYVCSVCQKKFPRKFSLDRHKKCCQKLSKNKLCSLCDFCASSSAEVLTHYEKDHNIDIPETTLNFKVFEEFKAWKQGFEKESKSRFIRKTGIRQTTDGVNIIKYSCHRDGRFQSTSRGIRHKRGTNKINSYCPANIIVYETDGGVKVVYRDIHIGHELDLNHLYITKSEKELIAKKLALNIPFNQILDDIHNSVTDGTVERIHFATRKDLWNIVKSYNLNHVASLNKKENLCVDVSQQPFDRRKQEIVNKVVQLCKSIETEEQLEAVSKQVASLEKIINAPSENIKKPEKCVNHSKRKLRT